MPKRKSGGKPKLDPLNQAVQEGFQDGINSILSSNSLFKQQPNYVTKHIDQKKLEEKAHELTDYAHKNGLKDEEAINYIKEGIADYVATGQALDDEGKEVILNSSLEKKAKSGFFKGLKARKDLEGKKYLEDTVDAFQELSTLLASGNYAERMPEVTEAVNTINDMGFLSPALEVLKYHGMIDDKKYKMLKKTIGERTEEAKYAATQAVEKYIVPQKAAAAVFGILGLGILISKIGITGNVVGNSAQTSLSIFGLLFLFISVLLYPKTKNKRPQKKKK